MNDVLATEGSVLEEIEIVCPVCGCENFVTDESGEVTCEDCDYIEEREL